MFKIRSAIYWQLAGLAVAVALISVLSPFFPVADFIEALQGGRRRLLFRALVGISHRVCRQRSCGSNFVCPEPLDSRAMVSAQAFAEPNAACLGAGRRTGELENCSLESVASTFPHKLIELSLWPNANSVSNVHALGLDRAGSGAFFVRVYRNLGSTWAQSDARQESTAYYRVLDLGRGVCDNSFTLTGVGPHCISSRADGRGEARIVRESGDPWKKGQLSFYTISRLLYADYVLP